jgi:hypothetical protein
MNNRGSVPWSPVSGFGCGRASRTSAAAANKSAARAMGREWQGPFSERSERMRGRSGFSFSPHSQDASEKRPCLRRRARQAGTFFRKVRTTGRDLFPKGPSECVANAGSFRLFILTSFAGRFGKASLPKKTLRKSVPAQEDASEKRPCLRRRFGKASLPRHTLSGS